MNTTRILSVSVVLTTALAVTFCKKETTVNPATASAEVPSLPASPVDYAVSHNDHLATLGRVLFYDKHLSRNNNISCGSCHQQQHAFTDNLQFSPGTDDLRTLRNTPSIFARGSRKFFWDGRVSSFQELVLRPVRDKIEMNVDNLSHLAGRLSQLDYYKDLFRLAYGRSYSIDSNTIRMALSEFMRNFNFSNNKFQQSQNGLVQLTPSEQLGKDLFFGKARCSNCHHVQGGGNSSGYGETVTSHNIGLDAVNSDLGVGALTHNKDDEGAFLMPVLLNIEFTAPYMHDGRFKTLEEVVEHYNSGIKDNPSLDRLLRSFGSPSAPPLKLNLTYAEKAGLVDFLKTLSDPAVLSDSRFSDPFVARAR